MRITVGKNNEDYRTIQEALNAVPYNTAAEIVISEGEYDEILFSDKKDLVFRGIGKVVIRGSYSALDIVSGRKRGTFRSYTAFFSGEKLVIDNVEFVNEASEGQAVALYLDADRALVRNTIIKSTQDTLFLAPLPDEEREAGGFYGPRHLSERKMNEVLILDSEIIGTVDFIFGGADALFDSCRIVSIGDGYSAAPSGKNIGFVFRKSEFIAKNSNPFIMRPWRKCGRVTLIGSAVDENFNPSLFEKWPGDDSEVNFRIIERSSKEEESIMSSFSSLLAEFDVRLNS